MLNLTELITEIYQITGPAMSLAYVPQIYRVLVDRNGAYTISILTWLMWTVSLTVTTTYSYFVVGDTLFFVSSLCSGLGCFLVSAVAIYKRIQYINRNAH